MSTATDNATAMGTALTMQIDRTDDDACRLNLSGDWRIGEELPSARAVFEQLTSAAPIDRIFFQTRKLAGWDSSLLTFLITLQSHCRQAQINVDMTGLPEGVQRLLSLAAGSAERQGTPQKESRQAFPDRLGYAAIALWNGVTEMIGFVGEAFLALTNFFSGRAQFKWSDLLLFIQETGVNALPIVSLIGVLIGLIFAFVGAVQLVMFGAQIYVANLVAIGIVRVMGPVMVAVIMAGRTGAAYAAQLGTMQVNEEIDALKTLGISPLEFLVLPRMLALIIMMPMLCLYADIMGILGGMIVGVGLLDVGLIPYLDQTQAALDLNHFFIGIFHSIVFGVLIALAGCLRGMQCGRSAAAVGEATTSAVVTAITAIVIATAIITMVCNTLGI